MIIKENGEVCGMKKNEKAVWMWYPADFEIYHGMKQNFQREERGCGWPAYWKMSDWRKNVIFSKEFDLDDSSSFLVKATGVGYVQVNKQKYPFETEIQCKSGKNDIKICVGNMEGLPAVFIDGEQIYSDDSWMVSDYETPKRTGTNALYTQPEQNPNQVYYKIETVKPTEKRIVNNGVLLDFGKMVNGCVKLDTGEKVITICYGESEREALDIEWCYYKEENVKGKVCVRKRAFRFLFLPNCSDDMGCVVENERFPIQVRASFDSNDEVMNGIWKTSGDTLSMCSELFFTDGAKRDRWIWSGDAYQSYFINQYYYFDPEISKRTILALRGNEEISQHLNTIVDYSVLWVISIYQYYMMTGDKEFLKEIYSKVLRMMEFLEGQLDEHGFLIGREGDWIFIDWSEDMDKQGALAAEQMLLYQCYKTVKICGITVEGKDNGYDRRAEQLKQAIMEYFWNEEKGAFIDSFSSGRCHVTRHANIFAVLFGIADQYQTEKIINNVLLNSEITAIKTPYFQFYELNALAQLGFVDKVIEKIRTYWGGMLKEGAVTFWEEYISDQDEKEKYAMYGDLYGKSLCHAWGAAPVYLMGRYMAGVYPLLPGYEEFAISPYLEPFGEVRFQIPVCNGSVWIEKRNDRITIKTDRKGGNLIWQGKKLELIPGQEITVEVKNS